MYLIGLHTYCKMMHGLYNIKLNAVRLEATLYVVFYNYLHSVISTRRESDASTAYLSVRKLHMERYH